MKRSFPKNKKGASHGLKSIPSGSSVSRFKSGSETAREPDPDAAPPMFVQIEKPVYGGAFLARPAGKAVFVPLALPGERVRVRVVEDKRGYATAEVEQIQSAAPERIAAKCQHFGTCGGCSYQHAPYEAQLEFKQTILRETLERGGLRIPAEISVLAAEPWAYRNRIRLALDGAGNPGYRGRRSHAVVPMTECPIAAPLLINAALKFGQVALQFPQMIRPREISLFCNAEQTALLMSIFTAGGLQNQFEDLALALNEQISTLKGIELVTEGRPGQPQRTVARSGSSSLAYRAAGFDYRVDHGAFFQVNRWLVDKLVEQVALNQTGALAWDLFAGVGLFARRLASSFHRVVAVESVPAATAALVHNLSGANATAVMAPALEFLKRNRKGDRPDLIVMDPPRTGLGPETTAALAQVKAPALVYVSCDPATLARDLRAFTAVGYEIESIMLADLFPQTFHLETVVHLRLSRPSTRSSRAGVPQS